MVNSLINYSTDILSNITGPTDVFVRMNYAAQGIVGLMILVMIMGVALFGMLRKGLELEKAALGASFITFISSLALIVFGEFAGVPMLQKEYVVGLLGLMVLFLVMVVFKNK